MRSSLSSVLVIGLMAGSLALPACEDSGGETGGGGSGGNTTAPAGGGGSGGTATTSDGGSTTGGGGTGGSTMTNTSAKCPGDPTETLTGEISSDKTLSADKCWLLKGIVFVNKGTTLTIEPGATIMGETASLGTLVIEPGAKIVADGTADLPIVFTSEKPKGSRAAGDWGGLILLGSAPINVPGGKAAVEGITGDGTMYGGDKADDDSGVLRYVRIEFSGVQLSPDNEINGLTLAGVGSKTVIDYVMVHDTLDDCFEFFGGTVNAKHLVCANNQDDGFDWDFGFSGKLQFLALQQDQNFEDDTNGFEADNDATGSLNTPISNPTIYNATLCGKNVPIDGPKQQFGMLLRRSTKGMLNNIIASGFEACIDLRDAATAPELESSICYGNTIFNVAYPEEAAGMGAYKDDDAGLDEVAWFNEAAKKNSEMDPKITDCFGAVPDFTPAATITQNAATPPNDGFFDTSASYIGAFKAGDTWVKGAWVSFDRN
ncbi:MAG: hypothetical protein R3B70_20620 [Polyangiaceae bacterium]